MDIQADSMNGLYSAWANRYSDAYKAVKNSTKGPPKSQRFNKLIWEELFSSYTRRKKALHVYQEEAIDTLTAAAVPAAAQLKQLIKTTHNDVSSSFIPPDGDENENIQGESLSSAALSLTLHPPGPNRLCIDNIDISERFYNLQKDVFNFVLDNTLTLESDVHLILSLSSILLLQNNNRLHKTMIPFFGNKIYQKVRQSILDSLNMTCTFPGENMLTIIQIFQSVYIKTTSRISAAASLLTLAETADDHLDKKAHCIRITASPMVVGRNGPPQDLPMEFKILPMEPTYSEIPETRLIARYILHAIQPLFDDDELDIKLDFTFTERVDTQNREISLAGCPDCIISIYPHQTDNAMNLGYGEVKKQSMAEDHYMVNLDLVTVVEVLFMYNLNFCIYEVLSLV
ncbi:uncharacterized protein EV154DRAFT_528726 [Mucor mucedo]|uniref:uncharacterized protein n=1 Tax=Mucor mucedo TaxID=29922 RepID=UPI00221F7D80|nr:uncharacterized protein EV154DRAFT_528726 [Mucor mucedo]KAI7873133.1 hypothetical protein EV154DRAFT_528726 [Mucor mucedo]